MRLILIISCMLICAYWLANDGSGETLTVDDDGPADHDNIRDAIDNATEGDTVFVKAGTYYGMIIIDKRIYLQGEHRETTILDGEEEGDVIRVMASKVEISDFTIQNSKLAAGEDAGILVDEPEPTIRNCIILDCKYGIFVQNNNHRCTVKNTRITALRGIEVKESDFHTFTNVTISTFNDRGIWDYYANSVIIRDSVIENCSQGILTDYGLLWTIDNCSFLNNTEGIKGYRPLEDATIKNCRFENNTEAIRSDRFLIDVDIHNNQFLNNRVILNSKKHSINFVDFKNNICINNRYGINSGGRLDLIDNEFFNTTQRVQDVTYAQDNQAEGKPFHILLNKMYDTASPKVFDDGGLVIAYNSSNFIIRNVSLAGTMQGFEFRECKNIVIWNASMKNQRSSERYPYFIYCYDSVNITIENSTLDSGSSGILLTKTVKVRIRDCEFLNQYEGVYIDSSSSDVMITGNLFLDNDMGIRITSQIDIVNIKENVFKFNVNAIKTSSADTDIKIAYNNFNHSAEMAVINSNYYDNQLVCTYNWWGSRDGPFHPETNNETSGDRVSDLVTYYPWLAKEFSWAPEAEILSISPVTIYEGELVTFTGRGWDRDGSVVMYRWSSSVDGSMYEGENSSFEINGLSSATHSISLMVKDDAGVWSNAVYGELVVSRVNIPPVVVITFPLNGSIVRTSVVNIRGTSDDEDGTVKFIEISIGNESWKVTDHVKTWTYELGTVKYNGQEILIRVRCYDGTDYSGEVFVQVTVEYEKDDKDPGSSSDGFIPGFDVIFCVVGLAISQIIRKRRVR